MLSGRKRVDGWAPCHSGRSQLNVLPSAYSSRQRQMKWSCYAGLERLTVFLRELPFGFRRLRKTRPRCYSEFRLSRERSCAHSWKLQSKMEVTANPRAVKIEARTEQDRMSRNTRGKVRRVRKGLLISGRQTSNPSSTEAGWKADEEIRR